MKTILVVDDHYATRELLRALLQHGGSRVLLAEDAEEALAIAEREQPGLIIADIVMPGMDGFDFLRALREKTPCKSVPVVLMSASLEEQKARRLAARCGAAQYVAKPFELEEMLAMSELLTKDKTCTAIPN